jgi:hypothetical protein
MLFVLCITLSPPSSFVIFHIPDLLDIRHCSCRENSEMQYGQMKQKTHASFTTDSYFAFSDLPEVQPFRTVHVCEAPGAFICATNFYHTRRNEKRDPRLPRRQWEWTGLSLNPYYEGNDQEAMDDDDRLIIETLDRWYFGIDNSGNILKPDNIKDLWRRIRVSSLIKKFESPDFRLREFLARVGLVRKSSDFLDRVEGG